MAVKGKNNQGLRGGVFEKKHRDAMGPAIWLFGWLNARQTKASGLVHGGRQFTYLQIAEDMHEKPRLVESWMTRLRKRGYIGVKHGAYKKLVIRILNQKKFPATQLTLPLESGSVEAKPKRIKKAGKVCMGIHTPGVDSATQKCGFKDEKRIEERKADEISGGGVCSNSERSPELKAALERIETPPHKEFRRFQFAYPKHEGTELAVRAVFYEVKGDRLIEEILDGIALWKTSDEWRDGFIMKPENFLRKRRWRDIPTAVKNGKYESFRERERSDSFAAIGRVLPDGVNALAGGISGYVPTTDLGPIDRELRRIAQRSNGGGAGRGVPAIAPDVGIHANGRDHPAILAGVAVSRNGAFDIVHVSGSKRGGTRDNSGSGSADEGDQREIRNRQDVSG